MPSAVRALPPLADGMKNYSLPVVAALYPDQAPLDPFFVEKGKKLLAKYGSPNALLQAATDANSREQSTCQKFPRDTPQGRKCAIRADPELLNNHGGMGSVKEYKKTQWQSLMLRPWFWPLVILASLLALMILLWIIASAVKPAAY